MKTVMFYYIPDPGIDEKTGKLVEILRPKIPIRLSANFNISKIS